MWQVIFISALRKAEEKEHATQMLLFERQAESAYWAYYCGAAVVLQLIALRIVLNKRSLLLHYSCPEIQDFYGANGFG